MLMNAIAGLILPFTLHNQAHVYTKLILEKK